MEKQRNGKFSFRQRGYVCNSCSNNTMVFGNDADPIVCPSCNAQNHLKKEWDHIVTTQTTVSPYTGQ